MGRFLLKSIHDLHPDFKRKMKIILINLNFTSD